MVIDNRCKILAASLLAGCLMWPARSSAVERMHLLVDTTNGQVTWFNQTGAPIDVDYYEITSVASALNASAWSSLWEQDRPDFPAGHDDTGNGWEPAGGSGPKVLSESFPLGQSTLVNEDSIDLGAAFNLGGARDLVFRYGVVPPSPAGDYNDNNHVDAADYTLWRDHLGASIDLPNDATRGTVSAGDFTVWKTNFGLVGDLTPASVLVTGLVEYLPPGSAATAPEPRSLLIASWCLTILLARNQFRRSRAPR